MGTGGGEGDMRTTRGHQEDRGTSEGEGDMMR